MPKPMSDRLPSEVADRIRQRGFHNLTEFAEYLNMPIATVNGMLVESKLITVRNFIRIAKALNLDLEELLKMIERN